MNGISLLPHYKILFSFSPLSPHKIECFFSCLSPLIEQSGHFLPFLLIEQSAHSIPLPPHRIVLIFSPFPSQNRVLIFSPPLHIIECSFSPFSPSLKNRVLIPSHWKTAHFIPSIHRTLIILLIIEYSTYFLPLSPPHYRIQYLFSPPFPISLQNTVLFSPPFPPHYRIQYLFSPLSPLIIEYSTYCLTLSPFIEYSIYFLPLSPAHYRIQYLFSPPFTTSLQNTVLIFSPFQPLNIEYSAYFLPIFHLIIEYSTYLLPLSPLHRIQYLFSPISTFHYSIQYYF